MTVWCALFFALSMVSVSLTRRTLDFPENVRGSTSRIVSGWEAVEGQFPYQLSLRMIARDGRVFACGATIIHSEWALTAAHCTARQSTLVIRAGAVALSRPELIFETTVHYNHYLYNDGIPEHVQQHDIGLIRFNRVLEFTDRVQPIRIQASADKNKNYHGIRLVASGWGATWTQGTSPENMNWVFLIGTTNEFCSASHGYNPVIVDSTICAANYNVTSQSTCQGDSGGLLGTVDVDGIVTQVGISSFVSSTGCHTGYPAGFIRPGHYHDWFTAVTGINFDWDPKASTPTVNPLPY